MSFAGCSEQCWEAAEAGDVPLPALIGVERQLGQRREDAGNGRDEGVTDRELGQGHPGRPCHAPGQHAHEVERLVFRLGQALVWVVICLSRHRFERGGDLFSASAPRSGSCSS